MHAIRNDEKADVGAGCIEISRQSLRFLAHGSRNPRHGVPIDPANTVIHAEPVGTQGLRHMHSESMTDTDNNLMRDRFRLKGLSNESWDHPGYVFRAHITYQLNAQG